MISSLLPIARSTVPAEDDPPEHAARWLSRPYPFVVSVLSPAHLEMTCGRCRPAAQLISAEGCFLWLHLQTDPESKDKTAGSRGDRKITVAESAVKQMTTTATMVSRKYKERRLTVRMISSIASRSGSGGFVEFLFMMVTVKRWFTGPFGDIVSPGYR